ncbi:MAG: phosphoenolpyruvate--protein phosphotransferase [Gammaproteobacteria bacterium]
MTQTISGTGISRGIVIGHPYRLEQGLVEAIEISIPTQKLEDEVSRFRRAIRLARQQLRAIRNSIPQTTRADITDFIDTHLLMLEDSMLTLAPVELIRSNHCNAEWALKSQRDALAAVFDEMDDPYLRTRKDDVDHVVDRIMRILLNQETIDNGLLKNTQLKNSIVITRDMTPAEMVLLQHQGIAGFVTESGGPLSHTAILARSLGIPAISGAHCNFAIHEDDILVLDGDQGLLVCDADEATLKSYRRLQRKEQKRRTELNRIKDAPATTQDGIPVKLNANIELKEDIRAARRYCAEGIGLYRTEFLFMNRSDLPDEEEQFRHYCSVLKSLKGIPLTIRTLDLGADKGFGAFSSHSDAATNPALGLRAIRLCLKHMELFKPQLRAILRASAKGPVKLMIPMLSSDVELMTTLELIESIKQELTGQGIEFDTAIQIGGMIEVPAAALSASLFARHLDFLSIGTNDLIQYTLAIDRIDDEVTYLYNPLHPAVLRLIQMTIEAGISSQVPVSMCGEMAGDEKYTRLLLGMGLTDFSMQPSSLLEVKNVIINTDVSQLDKAVRKLLICDTAEEIRLHLNKINSL